MNGVRADSAASSPNTGRRRAQRLYPAPLGVCEECRADEATERHHIDDDTFNNARSNVMFVCKSCHAKLDGYAARLAKAVERKRQLTRCVNGHRFTATNTYVRKGRGGRTCRTCARDRQRVSRMAAA